MNRPRKKKLFGFFIMLHLLNFSNCSLTETKSELKTEFEKKLALVKVKREFH
jgi:hypothetical protein